MRPGALLAALLALTLAAAMFLAGRAGAQENTDPPGREILVMLRLAPPHLRPNTSYGGGYGNSSSIAARRRIAIGIARNNRLELVDGWPMPLLGVDCYVMRLPAGISVEDAMSRLSHNSMVAWTEPMHIYKTQQAGRDGADPMFRAEPAAASWRLADLHRVATGTGISIAIIDSRIETAHPDLAGQFVTSQDFVGGRPGTAERHGTGIAGVIGAKAGNGIGIAGIAPGARLMALRACWQTGTGSSAPTLCNTLSLARALQYAIEHGAKVINLSLSGPPGRLLENLVAIALKRKTSVVAAFDPDLPNGGFPASQNGVIAVADETLQLWPSRLYGAPGRDVPTTQPGGGWYLVNGSSYAAAHVSGLLALVRQEWGAAGAGTAITRTPRGGVDACATLLRTSRACGCSCALGKRAMRKPAL